MQPTLAALLSFAGCWVYRDEPEPVPTPEDLNRQGEGMT